MDKNSQAAHQEATAPQLTPPDAQSQAQTQGEIRHLPSPPFVQIDGLYNFRDCGGYPIADRPNKIVRRGILYRSAEPSTITTEGISQLHKLNISRVFDLRSDGEIKESTKKGWGQIRVWDQAVRVPAAIFTDDYTYRAGRVHNLRNVSVEDFVDYYRAIIDSAISADNPFQPLRNILSHLATNRPSELEPILIHCSLGKDRTGVICALVLSLCGVEDSIIAREYALTALGIKDKVASVIAEIRPNGPGISEQGQRLFGARKEAMQAFLDWARRNGGLEQRVLESGLLTPGQLQQLRDHLVVDLPPGDTPIHWREHGRLLASKVLEQVRS